MDSAKHSAAKGGSFNVQLSPKSTFYALGEATKSSNLQVPRKTQAIRVGSPGVAARISQRNPGAFADLRIKPITNEPIDNHHFVPQKYLKPQQVITKEQILNTGKPQAAPESFGRREAQVTCTETNAI